MIGSLPFRVTWRNLSPAQEDCCHEDCLSTTQPATAHCQRTKQERASLAGILNGYVRNRDRPDVFPMRALVMVGAITSTQQTKTPSSLIRRAFQDGPQRGDSSITRTRLPGKSLRLVASRYLVLMRCKCGENFCLLRGRHFREIKRAP